MKLIFAGSGAAFSLDNYQSNMILKTDDGAILLIDCGGDIRFALRNLGAHYKDIDSVYSFAFSLRDLITVCSGFVKDK